MPIIFHCANCHVKIDMPDQAAGKQLTCGGCGALLVAPTEVGVEAELSSASEALELEPIMLELDEQPSPQPAPRRRRSEDRNDDEFPGGSGMNRFSRISNAVQADSCPPWQRLGNGVRWMELGVLGIIIVTLLLTFGERLVTGNDRFEAVNRRVNVLGGAMLLMVVSFGLLALGHYRSRAWPNPLVARLTRFSFWLSAAALVFACVACVAMIYGIYSAVAGRPAENVNSLFAIGTTAILTVALFFYVAESLFFLAVQRAAAEWRSTPIAVGAIFLLVVAILCSVVSFIAVASQLIRLTGGDVSFGGSGRQTSRSTMNIVAIALIVVVVVYAVVLESARWMVRGRASDKQRHCDTEID